jgi:hypothetical protein
VTIWAITPVKQLPHSKRGPEHLLPTSECADLITAFLDNLLDVPRQTR